MKSCRLIFVLFAFFAASACDIKEFQPFGAAKSPYELCECVVNVNLVEGSRKSAAPGAVVTMTEKTTAATYSAVADESGNAVFNVALGVYQISASKGEVSASLSSFIVNSGKIQASLDIKASRHLADICIKEMYFAGCKKLPEEGTYNTDIYFIVHNNSSSVQYLDSLCFGCADPYNANANNVWPSDIDYVPVIQAVWQFPGDGYDFALQPGQDAVVVVYGAIDHSAQYPLSVNLNKKDYFVCYNSTSFPNTSYHPAPGDQIQKQRILNLVIKVGTANAFTFSMISPALVLFKPKGMTIEEYLKKEGAVIQKAGSTDRIVCVPDEWVEDGVDVFCKEYTTNNKRLHSSVDAGHADISIRHEGHSIMRRKNEAASADAGYEILYDTNNSSSDFAEMNKQSLWEAK